MPRAVLGSSPFVDPAPGGQWGRTDEGVDWYGVRGNIVAVASGTITNVYHGLRGFGTTVIERVTGGRSVYYGEETGGGTPVVQPGQAVSQGQSIAPGTGGVIEVGLWDPSTGRPVGAPGYQEGKPTAAGQWFRSSISRAPAAPQAKVPITRPGGGSGPATKVRDILARYTALRDTPRTAPPGTKNPAKWFLASFTGEWDRFAAKGSGPTNGSTGAAPLSAAGHVTPAMLTRLGAPLGWSGQEVTDWMNLIRQESGGDPNAVNKSSGAYGIGQMLASGGSPSNLGPNMAKYRAYGGDPGSVLGQLLGMRGYIQQTYGSPSRAWAHEKANNWY